MIIVDHRTHGIAQISKGEKYLNNSHYEKFELGNSFVVKMM